jgi:hypothetical protein
MNYFLLIVVYKSSINETKKSKNPDHEEFDRLRQLYERTKIDLIEQTHQIQLMRDFYSEQNDKFKQEQIEYFIRILNLFENNFDHQENLTLDDIRNQFDQQINIFLTNYKSLLINDKDNSISNDLSLIITKFQEKFSHLFSNINNNEIILLTEDENYEHSVLNNLISFLNDLYKHVNKILHEKQDLHEKFIFVEKRNRKYLKSESKTSTSIHEDKHLSLNFKKSVNQMVEDLNQFQELPNSRSTICSSSSLYSTIGKNSVKILVFYSNQKIVFF